ncbi:MAG TPA: Mur ligase family protein, partial [Sphingobacteriaceae bacterium]
IGEDEVVNFVETQRENIEQIQPSFFEVTVAMAFDHFAKQQVDIAIIEVGLGGRLDSTNVITPLLSVITNIGYDHMNLLGNTLPEIASEKAGIIKPGVPVVIGEKQESVADIFLNKAAETGSALEFASDTWIAGITGLPAPSGLLQLSVSRRTGTEPAMDLWLDLTGRYQVKNIRTVLSAVQVLRRTGFAISDAHLSAALKQVKELTGLSGRWHTISLNPLVICDTGHNADGIREVMENIRNTPYRELHMVIGMVKDKDIGKVLELLPREATYYFCQPNVERGKPAAELAAEAGSAGLRGNSYPSVPDALRAAKAAASPRDLVFVGGSTFVVAEVV